VISAIGQVLDLLPPLKSHRRPNVACLVGLLAGGVGLAVYFRTVVDFIVPVGIAIVTFVVLGDVGVIGGSIISAFYGFARAQNSNERLAAVRA
jgi:hypothetical protein